METKEKKGKCIIFSAPSGAGKTTIVRHLLQRNLGLEFSVSACSREARGNEKHGKDYYFYSADEFEKKIAQNEFVEWEEVYKDMYYGTLKSEVERIWKNGKTVIFDVDVVGGLNLKKQFKEQALAVFVNPPSIDSLEERLRYRSTESEEKIQIRLKKAKQEMQQSPEFDVILDNFVLDEACTKAEQIVRDFIEKI